MKKILKDIASIGAGQKAPQGDSNYCENGVPFVKAANLQELIEGKDINKIQNVSEEVAKKHRLKIYPKGTIVFAKSGMSCMKGHVYILPQNSYVVNHLACITPNEELSEYLRLFFSFHKPNRLIKDTAYPSINLSDIANLEIDVKTAAERCEIVKQLKLTESVIFLHRKQLKKLDELIKSRFVEMFNKSEFEEKPFHLFCEFLKNGATIKQTKGAGGYPITRIETLTNDTFNSDKLGYANIEHLNGYEKFILQKGDILISNINSVAYLGRAVQYRGELKTPIIHGMNLLCARIKKENNPTYIEYFFKTPMAKNYISKITKKAVNQASITANDLKKMLIPAPPIFLQEQFAAFVEQVNNSKFAVQQALDKAQLLFDSLMQKYFK